MDRKGQYVMDFLITYGWAILVVLVAIGSLAYFGVFNTKNFIPSSCNIGCGIGNPCSLESVHNSTDSYNIVKCCIGAEFINATKSCEYKYQYSYLKAEVK